MKGISQSSSVGKGVREAAGALGMGTVFLSLKMSRVEVCGVVERQRPHCHQG